MNALFDALSEALGKLFNGCSPYLIGFDLPRPLVGREFCFLGGGARAYTAARTAYDHAPYVAAAAAVAAAPIAQDDALRILDVITPDVDLDESFEAHVRRIGLVDYYLRTQGGIHTDRIQRRYRLAVAEIVCEGVATVDLRKATKYDCFRVHNLGTDGAVLTADFGGHTVIVPARECRTVRRVRSGAGTAWHGGYQVTGRYGASSYFWPALAGDARLLNAGEGMPRDPERSLSANNVCNPHVAHAWLDVFTRRGAFNPGTGDLYERGFEYDPRLGPDFSSLYT